MGASCSMGKGSSKTIGGVIRSSAARAGNAREGEVRPLESSTGISDFGRVMPSNAYPTDPCSLAPLPGSLCNITEETTAVSVHQTPAPNTTSTAAATAATATATIAATATATAAVNFITEAIAPEERSKNDSSIRNASTAPNSPTLSEASTYEKAGPAPWFPEAIRAMPDMSRRLLVGAPGEYWPTDDKVIRILHIVNPSDSQLERQALLQHVYPKVQESCLQRGYEIEIIDPYWGSCTQEEHNESVRDIKSKTILNVTEMDPNLIVTVFLNEKYGSWVPPIELPVIAFETLYETLSDTDKTLLRDYYVRDESSGVTRYVRRPHIWHGRDMSAEEKASWDAHWEQDCYHLTSIFTCSTSQEFQQQYLISELEIDIDRVVFNPKRRIENVAWVHRKFNFMRFDKRLSHAKFTDVNKLGSRDEVAKNKLQTLANRLNARVDPNNELDMDVNWAQGGLSRSIREHAQYLDALCHHYQYIIQEMVDRVLEDKQKFDQQLVRFQACGLPSQFNIDLRQHMSMANSKSSGFVGNGDELDQLCQYLKEEPPLNTPAVPMLVHGPAGIGKSSLLATLFGQITRCDKKEKFACVYRYVGASANEVTEDALLVGVCRQLCLLLGLHATLAHKVSSKDANSFRSLLEKVSSRFHLYIILDGLDYLEWPESPEFSWIPNTLPPGVKMIISAQSDSHACNVLKTRTDRILVLNGLKESEMESLIKETSRECGVHLRTGDEVYLRERIRNPLHLRVAIEVLSFLVMRHDTLKEWIKDSLEEQIMAWFEITSKVFSSTLSGHCIQFLLLARQGISDVEMSDLLKCAGIPKLEVCCSRECNSNKLPQHIWLRLKNCFQPFLITRCVEGRQLTAWKYSIFKRAGKTHSSEINEKCKTVILNYFRGHTEHDVGDKNEEEQIPVVFKEQHRTYGKIVNARHLLEVPHHMIRDTKDVTSLAECLLAISTLDAKLSTVGIYHTLHDLDLLRDGHGPLPDIDRLFEILYERRGIFSQGAVHLKSILYSLSNNGSICEAITPLLYKMCAPLKNARMSILVGERFVRDTYGGTQLPTAKLHGVYRIQSSHNYCITVSTDAGEIKIWHIASGRLVRCLTGVKEPRNVKMLDACRAVVLSGRQLIVIDLDRGVITCKIKGVLNLKRCYYSIVDKDHVIALSRNRMCVNLMDANTGDVIATFKAGEDRFLNSLLVSRNGERCVCGDEVERPFPLLVWDLPRKKLTHDLRIPGYEFLTNMAAITDDGHYAVCVCEDTFTAESGNFLIVYDLVSGAIYKKWRPNYKTTCVAISSASAVVVSAHEDGSLVVWDLVSGAQRCQLDGHAYAVDTIRLSDDGRRCLSYDAKGRDLSVILHDLSEGTCLGAYSVEYGFTSCELSGDGKYVLLCLPGEQSILTLRYVGDVPTSSDELHPADEDVFGDVSRLGATIEVGNRVVPVDAS